MKYRQYGFTLIELLVALLISSTIVAAVSGIFMQSRKSFTKQQVLSNIVEDGRYATEIMAQEFRRVGFLVNAVRNDAGFKNTDIFFADNNPAGSGIVFNAGDYIKGKFSVAGFNMGNDKNQVVFRYQLDPAGTCTDPDNPLIPPDVVNKAECFEKGYTWTQTPNDFDAGNTPCSGQVSDENGIFVGGIKVSAYIKTIYFFVNNAGDGPTLYCRAVTQYKNGTIIDNNGGNAIPLVSNVESMYVLYGVDTDGDNNANRYVSATAVTNWQTVVSVRVYLVLMSSEINVATGDASTYKIDGYIQNALNPNDKRLYRVFTTTVAFRN